MPYNKDQWIESFEGRLQILRPHLTGRVLGSMSNTACIAAAPGAKSQSRRRTPCRASWMRGRKRGSSPISARTHFIPRRCGLLLTASATKQVPQNASRSQE